MINDHHGKTFNIPDFCLDINFQLFNKGSLNGQHYL